MKFLCLLSVLLMPTVHAGRHFLCCDHNGGKVAEVSDDGSVVWEYACRAPQDIWKLANGNVLFCHAGGAIELSPEKKIVWEYKAPEKTEVHACQPLADGRVMIVECGSSRLLELDREGKIAKEIKLTTNPAVTTHNQYRGARKLPNGHYLVCFKGEHKVVELDEKGTTVHELKVPGDVHEALRLSDGHLLVTCGDGHKVVEYDADDKPVWEINENDLPNNPLRLMAGCQRLANGNTLFCNYLGHGFIGKQPMIIEVTRDKKVVWEYANHKDFKTINQIFDLNETAPAVR